MKKIFFLLCMAATSSLQAQTSIHDCLAYPWVMESDIDAVYEFRRPCIILGSGQSYDFQNSENHKITADSEISITGDQEFHAGNFDASGEMWLALDPKSDLDVAVMNYPNLYNILRYEKFELGVELPSDISTRVNNYINATGTNKLNPFLDWELKVEAVFTSPTGAIKKVDGFYYVDMTRNPSQNNWIYQATPYPFRVRFAPPQNGKWTCQINIYDHEILSYSSDVFPFSVIESGNPGFVKVHPNQTNLQLGNQVIYPLGQTLPWPVGDSWNAQEGLNAWMNYHASIDTYIGTGNNFVRMLFAPEANDIEFEKLGNYYDRLDFAWEMDKVMDKLEEEDIYLHLTMMMHRQYMNIGDYGITAWDFSDDAPGDTTMYCYKSELGLTGATQLFTDPTALRYLKQRMRYLISRFGYSTAISAMDLGSEMYHTGATLGFYPNGTEVPCSGFAPYTDANDDFAREAVYNYHQVMSDYIKNGMGHKEHLLSVIYGWAKEGMNTTCNFYQKTHFPYFPWHEDKGAPDLSFALQNIDIISVNMYSSSPDRLIHTKNNPNVWFESNEDSKAKDIHDMHMNFGKPVMFTEVGAMGVDDNCNQNIQYYIDNMSIPFTGLAGVYQWHQGFNTDAGGPPRWDELKYSADFMNNWYCRTILGSNWKQYREVSESNPGSRELKEHQMYVSENQELAAGYVYNRTVNTKTMGVDSPCTYLTGGYYDEGRRHIYWDNDKHHYRGLKTNTDYIVKWYDYLTGNLIATECISTPKLSFDYEPIRHPDLYAWDEPGKPFRPIVWFTVEQNNCKSISSSGSEDDLSMNVYPNPSTGVFSIELQGGMEWQNSVIGIYDLLGREISVIMNEENPARVDLSGQPAGTYIVRVTAAGQTLSTRMTITKE